MDLLRSSTADRILPSSPVEMPASVDILVKVAPNLFDMPTAAVPAATIGAVIPNVMARPAPCKVLPSLLRLTPDAVTRSVAAAACCIPAMYCATDADRRTEMLRSLMTHLLGAADCLKS